MRTRMNHTRTLAILITLLSVTHIGMANVSNTPDSTHRVIHFSLFPYLSTNGLGSYSTINNFSLNTTVGFVGGVNGLEIGGAVNMVKWNMNGLQIAGATNMVGGNANGFQCAGAVNMANRLTGGQVAGAVNIVTGDASQLQVAGAVNIVEGQSVGLQCAGAVNTNQQMVGTQIAGAVNITGPCKGLQIAGAVNIAEAVQGAQIAGAVNIADAAQSAQIAGAANVATSITGLQLAGAVNIADTVKGVQISGAVNKASHLKGFQLGVVNYADTCEGIPFGVINIVRRGGVHNLDFYADEVFHTNIAFRSGVPRLHTILQVGIQDPTDLDKPLWSFGWGLGSTIGVTNRLQLDLDLRSQHIAKGDDFSSYSVNMLHRLGVGGSWSLARGIALTMGITYNLHITDTRSSLYGDTYSTIAPYHITSNDVRSNYNLRTWVGGRVGIRFF